MTEMIRSQGPYPNCSSSANGEGCMVSHEYDETIKNERKLRPELITSRSNMTYHDRKLCRSLPFERLRSNKLLKALGAPKSARIYWAGGNPLGGKDALQPLIRESPHFYNKENLALPGELEPFAKRASFMAAIDYIVSENNNVFMSSHGMSRSKFRISSLQGHRAYAEHKKTITPNKRQMLLYVLSSLAEAEFNRIIMDLHLDSFGQPELRTNKAGRDVRKYPIPECMCNRSTTHAIM